MRKVCALAMSIILGATLSSCAVRFEVRDREGTSVKTYETTSINNEVLFEDEDSINIEIKYGEINITSYDGSNVQVSGSTNRGIDIIKLEKINNSIIIRDTSSEDIVNNVFSSDIKMNLDIKVPKSFNGEIDLDYGAGVIKLNDISCKEFNIDGGAGQLIVNDIVFDKLYVNAGVGQVDITLSEKCGEIDIDGGVGEIKISLAEVGGNFTLDGGIGRTEVKLPQNAPIYFETDSGIGNSSINATTSGENTYKFKLSIGIGEMKIYN